MAATMMPGAPVADAVFAELEPRVEKLIANGHTPGSARSWSATTVRVSATSA
jgi:hypothetical protein